MDYRTCEQNDMTYGEALDAGYKKADVTWERTYVSRKVNPRDQPVLVAGGRRKGDLYMLLPSWMSTTYCHRQYIKPPE